MVPRLICMIAWALGTAACDGEAGGFDHDASNPDGDAGARDVAALCHDKCTAKLKLSCATDTLQECLDACLPGNTGVCGAAGTALDVCLLKHAEPWFCFLTMVAIKPEVCRPEQDALYKCQLENPRPPASGPQVKL